MSELETALGLARQGAECLAGSNANLLARPDAVWSDSPSERVTDLDSMVEDLIAGGLSRAFPNDWIFTETGTAAVGTSEFAWYVDPVDGTDNLIAGRPEIAISIARYEHETPRLGVIVLPGRGIELYATATQDAICLNGVNLTPPRKSVELGDALVGLPGGVSRRGEDERLGPLYSRILPHVRGVRVSAAIAYELAQIAIGELDARLSWAARATDVAAGVMLVRTMGGAVTDVQGDPWSPKSRSLLASSNPRIHDELISLIRG